MNKKEKSVDKLLEPSWLSGLIAVLCGLIVTVGIIVAFSYNNSDVQQQIIGWQSTSIPALSLTLPGEAPPGTTVNSLQNTWPLLGFWMIVGLIVYFVVEAAVRGLNQVAEFRRELGYVNADKDFLVREAIEIVAIRLLAAAFWLFFIELFFKRIIPYSILAGHASAAAPGSAVSFLYALLSFTMIALSLHLQTIFLRLVAGRSRLFSFG
jgi:hypothetical protein